MGWIKFFNKPRLYILLPFFSGCLTAGAQTSFPGIDVQHYTFALRLNDENDTIKGRATVTIKFTKDIDTLRLNLVRKNKTGKGMVVSAVTDGGRNLLFRQDSDVVNINSKAKENSVHSFMITYQGIPADGLIISKNEYGHRTFFGDNWPNRAHYWLPCADYPGDKATVDFVVTAPDHYQVVSNGIKTEETMLSNHYKLTHWKETASLPTKVMVIGAADFAIDHIGEVDDIPVYSYVFPENKEIGFRKYESAVEILNFYIQKFGSYPYKKLANIQSKTKFGGMENASAIFYFENSVNSKGIEELMAHEIAHQWFGDAVSETNFTNIWLSEGFATYMCNTYLENKYGPDTLKKRLAHDRSKIFNFEKTKFTPVVDFTEKNNYMALLNTNSYEKGGWVLHMLRRKIGDEAFWKGIKNYYEKFNGGNANTDSLRKIMENASGKDLTKFFYQWLYAPGHPQLQLTWKYDNADGVELTIIQKQFTFYEFTLEVLINNKSFSVNVKDKKTTVQFPVDERPPGIIVDPDVNLLATFEVVERN